MTRFTAETLDLSRLPEPTLVPVDYGAIIAARRASLIEAMAAAGIPYDVADLETDSAAVLQEVDAFREMLGRQAINDAGRANMLAHARGADLEGLAANFGVARLRVGTTPAGVPIMETDERLRRRVQLAPEAYATAGSAGGYIFHALTAVPTLGDASVQNPAPGEVVVTVMGGGADPTPTAAEVEAARQHLFREDIKPITDILSVQGAEVILAPIVAELVLYPGPDSGVVVADARKALEQFLSLNRRLGRDLRRGAIIGRLQRDTVHSVNLASPAADLPATPGQAVYVPSVTLTVSGRDE